MKTNVLLVLNARTDIYLDQVGPEGSRYDETLKRTIAFRDAGADCIFVPGLHDADTIERLMKDLKCPLNILVGPGAPSVATLERLGVARLSVGSAIMRATLGAAKRAAEELKTSGTYAALEGGVPYGDLNNLLSR
jgi:2-methylisocitrate lyase-like PEP mutase family enzyme